MTEFKAGDKVRALETYGQLVEGRIYTVESVRPCFSEPEYDLLYVGLEGGYYSERFKLVTKPSADHRGKLDALLDEMNDDELKVILYVAKRIDHGRAEYGGLNISRGDWRKELAEEQADSIVYVACDAIKRYLDADPLK